MAHSGWTPEPWERSGQDGTLLIKVLASGGMNPVADANVATRPGSECLANARRIVACVNACRGIPTEALEGGAVQEMRDALQAMLDAFVLAEDAPPLKSRDGSRTGWQFMATRTLTRVRELLERTGQPVPDRALARFLGEASPS